jgi:hypothetical protein
LHQDALLIFYAAKIKEAMSRIHQIEPKSFLKCALFTITKCDMGGGVEKSPGYSPVVGQWKAA